MLHTDILRPEDLLAIRVQRAQRSPFMRGLRAEHAENLSAQGEGRTVRDSESGLILFCGGYLPLHAGRALLWAVLASEAAPRLHGLTKTVRGFLDAIPHRRLETSVRSDFPPGHRWARLLGFECEGVMRAFGEEGENHHLYARIRT